MAYADAVNEEIARPFRAGADIVQLDEPYLQARPGAGARSSASTRSTGRWRASPATTALHICFGYARSSQGAASPATRSWRSWRSLTSTRSRSRRPSRTSTRRPERAAGQDGHPRRHRPQRSDRGDRRRGGRTRSARALPYIAAERLVIAPDCGMKYLPREVAFGKLKAMADGAALARRRLWSMRLGRIPTAELNRIRPAREPRRRHNRREEDDDRFLRRDLCLHLLEVADFSGISRRHPFRKSDFGDFGKDWTGGRLRERTSGLGVGKLASRARPMPRGRTALPRWSKRRGRTAGFAMSPKLAIRREALSVSLTCRP